MHHENKEATANNLDSKDTDDLPLNKENKPETLCLICKKNPPKYRCPKCFSRTCSLPCVKQHKEISNCDGIRCKTAYVSMPTYKESHMLSDYRLLEEIARCCDNHDRQIKKSLPTTTKWMNIQRKAARNMNIHLKLLPFSFTKHKLNSTYFNAKMKSFSWHVAWHFPTKDLSFQKRKIPDSKTLSQALSECLESELPGNPSIREYTEAKELCIFMKRVDLPANQEKYHKMDPSRTIKQALHGKTIVEFPQFIVVLPEEATKYKDNISEEVVPFPVDNFRGDHNRKFERPRFQQHRKRPQQGSKGKPDPVPEKISRDVPNTLVDPGSVESFP